MPVHPSSTRRGLLLGGLGAGLAGMLPAGVGELPAGQGDPRKVGSNGNAEVPSTLVSLADYGGRPGVAPAILAGAFHQGFAALAAAGGGTLFVPGGLYDFGTLVDDAAVLCRDARDIAISAYGATFVGRTPARSIPNLFYFFNFYNVTVAGASFIDRGFTPWFNWQGMYCVGLQADAPSSRFRMVDCSAQRVVGLLSTHNNATTRRFLEDVSVQGEVRDTYYGVSASCIQRGVDVDLTCHNVRRAFIAYALQDARIAVRLATTLDWPGSNGLVALVSGGAHLGNVENVRVSVDVTGASIHGSYVHFYHQGPERLGVMRDIDATVNAVHLRGANSLFSFDHETDGVRRRTSRTWDRIALHGKIVGPFTGKVVSNASVSDAPGTVYLDRNLAALADRDGLAPNFRVRPP
ncbi:MAG: hypothetical protein EOP92_27870 [Lysobacteraceae bacterium]|nr:MAG: hypothetical protein EOP92_27870 [Xanthomonadaceae bacterium]